MSIQEELNRMVEKLRGMGLQEKVQALNEIRRSLHEVSPFRDEPVDCIRWVPAEEVGANHYNPNKVAPPEMELLAHSIRQDGYTQPIVSFRSKPGEYEVVDGFHRHKVGKEIEDVRDRVQGYLPVVVIN